MERGKVVWMIGPKLFFYTGPDRKETIYSLINIEFQYYFFIRLDIVYELLNLLTIVQKATYWGMIVDVKKQMTYFICVHLI